jgi:hypothetical protein
MEPVPEAHAAPEAPAAPVAPEAPVAAPAPDPATLTASSDAAPTASDLSGIAQSVGGDSALTIVLAVLAVVGGGAAWKTYQRFSEQKHEQAMEKLKLDREAAGMGGAQPPPCAVKQAEVDAKLADLSAKLAAVEKKTATMSTDFDGDDVVRDVKKLQKAVKALQEESNGAR